MASVNIDILTEAELIDLNRRVVERLRFMRQARAHVKMLEFRIGEQVWFHADDHRAVFGVLTRYNKKTVTVIANDDTHWNVAPQLLKSVVVTPPPAKLSPPHNSGAP